MTHDLGNVKLAATTLCLFAFHQAGGRKYFLSKLFLSINEPVHPSSLTTQHSQCVSHSSPSSALWLHTPLLSPFQALMRLPMVERDEEG
ncbi:hypothetical protein BDN67DRAFT_967590 [Paxillus ammoniavirescens]|nr:hypothetical protein BDN67DRAFT_967590 [Paxillus ammoniavirescens]